MGGRQVPGSATGPGQRGRPDRRPRERVDLAAQVRGYASLRPGANNFGRRGAQRACCSRFCLQREVVKLIGELCLQRRLVKLQALAFAMASEIPQESSSLK